MAETNGVSPSPAAENPSKAVEASSDSNAPVQTNGTKDISTSEAPPDGVNVNNTARRPRDARTIHLMLASLGVTSYQERCLYSAFHFCSINFTLFSSFCSNHNFNKLLLFLFYRVFFLKIK